MPFGKEDMPTAASVKRWEYLKEVAKLLPTYNADIPFGLMLGGNSTKSLEPHECIPSIGKCPFAYRTLLGWCVVGRSSGNRNRSSSERCLFTQVRVLSQDVTTGEKNSHYFLPF